MDIPPPILRQSLEICPPARAGADRMPISVFLDWLADREHPIAYRDWLCATLTLHNLGEICAAGLGHEVHDRETAWLSLGEWLHWRCALPHHTQRSESDPLFERVLVGERRAENVPAGEEDELTLKTAEFLCEQFDFPPVFTLVESRGQGRVCMPARPALAAEVLWEARELQRGLFANEPLKAWLSMATAREILCSRLPRRNDLNVYALHFRAGVGGEWGSQVLR